MTVEEIRERCTTIIAEQLGLQDEEVLYDKSLDELGADSLDQVELVMALEAEFDICIDDDESNAITTVKAVFDYVESRKG